MNCQFDFISFHTYKKKKKLSFCPNQYSRGERIASLRRIRCWLAPSHKCTKHNIQMQGRSALTPKTESLSLSGVFSIFFFTSIDTRYAGFNA